MRSIVQILSEQWFTNQKPLGDSFLNFRIEEDPYIMIYKSNAAIS